MTCLSSLAFDHGMNVDLQLSPTTTPHQDVGVTGLNPSTSVPYRVEAIEAETSGFVYDAEFK